MWYTLKRYFYYRLIILENYFRTAKKQKEIARAYRPEKTFPEITITRHMFVWSIIVTFSLGLVIAGVIYSDKIVTGTIYLQKSFQSKKKLSDKKQESLNTAITQKDSLKGDTSILQQIINKDTITSNDIDASSLKRRVVRLPEKMDYLLLANKANRTMWVLNKRNNNWSLFRKYLMAIGENEGVKIREGDKKTPEGIYFIIGRKERSELNKMYGPLAFVLNYPNEEDRKRGRTGNGIWIHGTNPDSIPLQTRGCLELENVNILELGMHLKTGIGTPIVIINSDSIQDPLTIPDFNTIEIERREILTRYKKQRDFFVSLLEKWENAWESMNIENYAQFYHEDKFFGQGLDWPGWKEKKSRTFQIYSEVQISIDKIFLADISESTAVLKFMQGYKSDRLDVLNGKKLNLVKSDGGWKIYQENSFPQQELVL